MKGITLATWSGRYLAALRNYVKQTPPKDLAAAHEPGCHAVALNLETLELARVHDRALAALWSPAGPVPVKRMSLTLRDEIAQTLPGLHVGLLAVQAEVTVSRSAFQKEIATIRELVQDSFQTINCFVRECGIVYEN